MVQQRGPLGTRVLYGLLAMAGKHPVAALERAAQKALHHDTWRLRDLRALLAQPGPTPQLDFLETHPLIRPLNAYGRICDRETLRAAWSRVSANAGVPGVDGILYWLNIWVSIRDSNPLGNGFE